MKQIKLLLAVFAFSLLVLAGCKKAVESEAEQNEFKIQDRASVKKTGHLSLASKQRLDKLISSLPAGFKDKANQRATQLLETNPQYRAMVLRALSAITPTPCNDNTAINQWLDQQFKGWNKEVVGYVLDFAMLDLPTYDALVFENSSENQYFGKKGEYTRALTKTFKDLQRFWDIQSADIVLAAMHGNMLQNRERIIRTYVAVYGVDLATANILADIVVELVGVFPQYRNGEHPIFTFNAFALQGFEFPPYGIIPDKIIMGDGILEAFTAVGYEDVAPQTILAHEFGHQIQYQLNLFEEEKSPEATRRTELMADAYAAYYLSHARGAAMQWKRVQQFLQVFFNIGDCSFKSDNHHGTPTQRMAAAEWAYNLANDAQKQGHILSAQEFAVLFDAQLPQLILQ